MRLYPPKNLNIQTLKKKTKLFYSRILWDAEVLLSLEGAEAPARPGLPCLLLNLG